MSKGRKRTTGRFNTRLQLEERVWFLYRQTSCNVAAIARNCEVSEATVSSIINKRGVMYDRLQPEI